MSSSHCPDAAKAGAAGVNRSGQTPLPANWAGTRQLVARAAALSLSRFIGYTRNTAATEVLTCRDEEASICYLSGEFLFPLWQIIRREMLLQSGEPASPGLESCPSLVPSLSSESDLSCPSTSGPTPRGLRQEAAQPSGLERFVPTRLLDRSGLNRSQDVLAWRSSPQQPK